MTSVQFDTERLDPAAVIATRALEGTDPLSERALYLFTGAYGAQAGNLALTVMASGGVFSFVGQVTLTASDHPP